MSPNSRTRSVFGQQEQNNKLISSVPPSGDSRIVEKCLISGSAGREFYDWLSSGAMSASALSIMLSLIETILMFFVDTTRDEIYN